MGQMGRLRLIHDRFIAGHSSCELHRYLDSVPPETPIRDVVDRCRVWESHADPEIRRVSKPSLEPIYLASVIGDSDNVIDEIRVAAFSTTDFRLGYPPSPAASERLCQLTRSRAIMLHSVGPDRRPQSRRPKKICGTTCVPPGVN